jgi:uncharacterized protein DUF6256
VAASLVLVTVLRGVVAPVAAAYAVFVAALVANARDPARERRPAPSPEAPWGRAAARVAATVAGGFVAFAVIVVVFTFELGTEPAHLVLQALAGGSALAFGIVLPAFLVLDGVERWWTRRRRSGLPGEDEPS